MKFPRIFVMLDSTRQKTKNFLHWNVGHFFKKFCSQQPIRFLRSDLFLHQSCLKFLWSLNNVSGCSKTRWYEKKLSKTFSPRRRQLSLKLFPEDFLAPEERILKLPKFLIEYNVKTKICHRKSVKLDDKSNYMPNNFLTELLPVFLKLLFSTRTYVIQKGS